MISSLIEFGRWLVENDLNDYGKNIKSNDFILKVSYENNNFVLNNNFVSKENFESNFFQSMFNEDLFFPPKPVQNNMIPNANAFSGFTPFVIKLAENPSAAELNKLEGKSKRARFAHYNYDKDEFQKEGRWNVVLNEIYEDIELNFFNKCFMSTIKKNN